MPSKEILIEGEKGGGVNDRPLDSSSLVKRFEALDQLDQAGFEDIHALVDQRVADIERGQEADDVAA